jgi:hypothetical protein
MLKRMELMKNLQGPGASPKEGHHVFTLKGGLRISPIPLPAVSRTADTHIKKGLSVKSMLSVDGGYEVAFEGGLHAG